MFRSRKNSVNGAQRRDRLDATAAELVGCQRPGDFEGGLVTQGRILQKFAMALDLSYLETRAACDFENGPFLIVGGFFVPPGQSRPPRKARHDHVQVMVSEGNLLSREGSGLVAAINELRLPLRLQRRGLAPCLLNMLGCAWRRLGVDEAQAVAVSEAGQAAFSSWGFRAGPTDAGLREHWLSLASQAGA